MADRYFISFSNIRGTYPIVVEGMNPIRPDNEENITLKYGFDLKPESDILNL